MATLEAGGVGEQRLAENRRRFRHLVWSGLLLGGGIGLVTGFVSGFTHGWRNAGGDWIGWLVWPMLAVALLWSVRFCRTWLRQVDELDLQDNLWSSLVGFYVSFALVPIWWVLHDFGQLSAPGGAAWTVWGISAVASIAAYGWRKISHRF